MNILSAKDCLEFNCKNGDIKNEPEKNEVLQYFQKQTKELDIFNNHKTEENPIIEWKYFNDKWQFVAGRYVGTASFNFEASNRNYTINIHPRFGQLRLMYLCEQAYDIQFSKSQGAYTSSDENWVKQFISLLWLQTLSKANRHGLPRLSRDRKHEGLKIRGRLNVRESIIPLKTKQRIVSNYRERDYDPLLIKLLDNAYTTLQSDFNLDDFKRDDNMENAIHQISNARKVYRNVITKDEYNSIQLKRVYNTFLPLKELSWKIIQNKNLSRDSDSEEDSFSFFLDMAEIWEEYLRKVIREAIKDKDWKLLPRAESKSQLYKKCKVLARKIIPDFILQNGNKIAVFDAKYKRMKFDKNDIDRSDFYQIHTYIQYYNQEHNVIAGGLLYPITQDDLDIDNRRSDSLFGLDNGGKTQFIVDGIEMKEIKEPKESNENDKDNLQDIKDEFEEMEKAFKEMEKGFKVRFLDILGESCER